MTDLDLLRAELDSVKEQRDVALRLVDRLEEQLFRQRLARTLPGIPLHGEPATEAEMRLGRDPMADMAERREALARAVERHCRLGNPRLRLVVDNEPKESA